MSPLFGHKDEDGEGIEERFEQWRQATRAEFERLNALSLVDLATEVMTEGFGGDGLGADDDSITLGQANFASGPTANGISYRFAPDWVTWAISTGPRLEVVEPRSSAVRSSAYSRPGAGRAPHQQSTARFAR